jgi:hypothetical protein
MGCNQSSSAVQNMDVDMQGNEPEAPFGNRILHSSRAKGWVPQVAQESLREWSLQLVKRQGDVLGAGLGNTDKGAVIFNIQENGLLDGWNKTQVLNPLRPGLIITEVNGVMGYWNILDELRRPGVLDMKVSAEPPQNAGPNWFQEIAEMGKNLEAQGGKSSFMLRLQPQDPSTKNQFSSLPTVRAADCGVDQCAICIDDVGPDEQLVQLPCKHAFHALCAARWLTQAGRHSQGKRQCCPLCCQKVVCSPDGGIVTGRSDESVQ